MSNKYNILLLMMLLPVMVGCTELSSEKRQIYPNITITVLNDDGKPIPRAKIEEQWLYEDGYDAPPVPHETGLDGKLKYSVGIKDVDGEFNGPASFSIQLWVYAEGYKPARQIFQVRQQETAIEFRLTKE